MSEEKTSVCQGGPTLIFSCSGAADTGAISDLAARQMMSKGWGQMFCLAGVGGRVEPILKKTNSADSIIAIDGCGLDCTKRCLEEAGFDNMQHIRITDMGMEKGQSPATPECVQDAVNKIGEKLGL